MKVIDICCGRGGDINKLTQEFITDLYVGFDISYDELNEVSNVCASNRYTGSEEVASLALSVY